MSTSACPGVIVATDHIQLVMRKIESTLNPQENLKEEVVALHDVYLARKNILEEIRAKHVALRHQQRILARESCVDSAAHRVRAPRLVRTHGACTVVASAAKEAQTEEAPTTARDEPV